MDPSNPSQYHQKKQKTGRPVVAFDRLKYLVLFLFILYLIMNMRIHRVVTSKIEEHSKESKKTKFFSNVAEKRIDELVRLSAEAEKIEAKELAENNRLHKKGRPPGQLAPDDPYYNPHHHLDDGFEAEPDNVQSKKDFNSSNNDGKKNSKVSGNNLRAYPQPNLRAYPQPK